MKNLIDYDKEACIKLLETATNEQLWDAFLEGQSKLLFPSDFKWLQKQAWWTNSSSVLEIGSGNGAYLAHLAEQFPEKKYLGIELLPLSVIQSNQQYAQEGLRFEEGNAEIFNEKLKNSADVILFRLTLQHLEQPFLALEHAWHYLVPNGYLFIMDSCDAIRNSSPPMHELERTLKAVAEYQKEKGKGNRQISSEILAQLQEPESPLQSLYELVFNNLSKDSHLTKFEGTEQRKLYFTHNLLFLTLLSRKYLMPADLNRGYDEAKVYLEDEGAWTTPGTHYMVLRKLEGV